LSIYCFLAWSRPERGLGYDIGSGKQGGFTFLRGSVYEEG
jgi:hypothetical protein